MQHYIRLLTDIKLNNHQKHIWFRTAEKFLGPDQSPEEESSITQLHATREETKGEEDFPYVYIVYVEDRIDMDIAEKIVRLWSKIYPRDFEIESSAELGNCDECDIEIDQKMYEEIKRRASKFLHNRWVDEQVQNGWRYGLNLSKSDKTTPKLRDWDNLNEQYRTYLNLTNSQAITFLKEYSHLFV